MTIRASKFDGKLLKLTCHQIWKKLDGLYLADWPITFLQVLQRPESACEPLHNNNLPSVLFEL